MIKCVIFDFDGVIVDSHNIINKLFVDFFGKELDIRITEDDFARFPGMRFEERIKILAKEQGREISEERINELNEKARFEYYTNRSNYVKLYEGVVELFKELQKNNVRIALGSNGSRHTIEKMLKNLDIIDYFDSMVAYDDVANPKPAPDMFLKNAENLNLEASECVVVEDSIEGVEAANHADMKMIAVKTTTPENRLKEADVIIETVKDINMNLLQSLK